MTLPAPPPLRLPEWIREKKLSLKGLHEIKKIMRERSLHTVCEELACPNRTDCFTRGTATFMILGDVCTRTCGFCNAATGVPFTPPDPDEPAQVADAASKMGLKHVVVTSVNRDELPDGGAEHFARTIHALRAAIPGVVIEVLTPDFKGDRDAIRTVTVARPDYFNHNVETVPRLYRKVRPGARFERSTGLLRTVREIDPAVTTKSGLMVGLGETFDEVIEAMKMLREAEVRIVTIGQYLRPSLKNLPVAEYVHPEVFEEYRRIGEEEIGFDAVFSGPFVRSSYMADAVAERVTSNE